LCLSALLDCVTDEMISDVSTLVRTRKCSVMALVQYKKRLSLNFGP